MRAFVSPYVLRGHTLLERLQVGQLHHTGAPHPALVSWVLQVTRKVTGVQHQEEVAPRRMDPVDADVGL